MSSLNFCRPIFLLGLGFALVPHGAAAGEPPTIVLPGRAAPAAATVPADQLAVVQRLIAERVPECPPDRQLLAAMGFAADLQRRAPQQLAALAAGTVAPRQFESELLRNVAAQLADAKWGALRETVARRRLEVFFLRDRVAPEQLPAEASRLLAKLGEASPVHARRLLEGKLEDEDLELVLKRIGRETAPKSPGKAPAAKVLTAADIVSAFARENQEGAALQRLRAYTLDGAIETAPGETRRVVLHRLRPDRFRFTLQAEGATSLVTAFDGNRYWQQVPGRPIQSVSREAMGRRRFLGEFVDPLFGESGASFTRLEDGTEGGRSFYRLEVRRADASRYVSRIHPETFRQIGQENEDGSVARYSDHREIGGVWIAFREEVTEKDGAKRTFVVNRVTPNPGLLQALFEAPAPSAWNLHALEQVFPALAREAGK